MEKKTNSDVLFTLGNHDYLSIILCNIDNKTYFKYKHPTSITYFTQTHKKSKTMFEIFNLFYSISPYLLLVLKNDTVNEFICTHAGFITRKNNDTLLKLIEIQMKINRNELTLEKISVVPDINVSDTSKDGDPITLFNVLETRDYVNIKCDETHIKDNNVTYVVGHCPTSDSYISRFNHFEDDYKQPNYAGCSKKTDDLMSGCVIADCFYNKKPRLIFVDSAMSHAMRPLIVEDEDIHIQSPVATNAVTNNTNVERTKSIQETRNIEFLLLEHTDSTAKAKMWINLISRKLTNVNKRDISLFEFKKILYDEMQQTPLQNNTIIYAFDAFMQLRIIINKILENTEKATEQKNREIYPHLTKCKSILLYISGDINPKNEENTRLLKQIQSQFDILVTKVSQLQMMDDNQGGGNKSNTNNSNNNKKNFQKKRKHINKKTNKKNNTNKKNKTKKTNNTNKLFF